MTILKIYRIVNNINNFIYIGSTYKLLYIRFEKHIRNAKGGSNNKLYNYMREIGIENFKIKLIKEIEMKLPEEYEQEEINKLNPNILLNSQDAFAIDEKVKTKIKKIMADRNYKIKNNEELYTEHKRKNRKWFNNKMQDDEYKAKYYERKKKERKYVLLKMKLFSQF